MHRTTHPATLAGIPLRPDGTLPPLAGGDPDDGKTVPLDQLIAEREKARNADEARKAAEKAQADAEAKLKEKERADLGDVAKLQAQVDDLTRERDDAVRKATEAETARERTEREGWVRDAAAKVKFKDGDKEVTGSFRNPAMAIRNVDLAAIKTPEAAAKAVASLAASDSYLVAVEGAGRDDTQAGRLQQVLKNGDLVGSDDKNGGEGGTPDVTPGYGRLEQAYAATSQD